MDATDVKLPTRVPRGTWDDMAQRTSSSHIVVTLRPGDDGHPKRQSEPEQTIEWLRDYFDVKGLTKLVDGVVVVDGENTEEDARIIRERRVPFSMTNERHLFIDDFVKWVVASRGIRLTERIMGSRLRDAGMNDARETLGGGRVKTWFISDRDWADVAF